MADEDSSPLLAKVLTVSDGVVAGTREDRSGAALAERLGQVGYTVVERALTADGAEAVAETLEGLCEGFAGLVITTGGTGFGPRDLTPEGTLRILDRHAPGLAEAGRAASPKGALSRGVAGTRGAALIINAPGSPRGATETFDALENVLAHAVRLLAGEATTH